QIAVGFSEVTLLAVLHITLQSDIVSYYLVYLVLELGHLDDDGLPHGFCTVTYSSTDRFEGNFVHGEKNGRGKFFFFDGSTLEGYYVDDALQGQGVYTYEDGGVLQGTYVDGELNGPAQEYDTDGRLIFKGQYKDNIRHGVCWIYYPVSLVTSWCWKVTCFKKML
uniref:Histone-lysine N-methyltransferase SETD7 n=1 Tax=Equus asinus TaxID=9793 RepID=A0A9L0K4T0_EQUAS